MNKGEKPYDQAAVDEALKTLDDTAKQLPKMFPASIKAVKFEGDYNTSPKIWEDEAGFKARSSLTLPRPLPTPRRRSRISTR